MLYKISYVFLTTLLLLNPSKEQLLRFHHYIENGSHVEFQSQEDFELVRYSDLMMNYSSISTPNMEDLVKKNHQYRKVKDKCETSAWQGRKYYGGRYATIQEVPYLVSLRRRSDDDTGEVFVSHCSGTLVTPDYVITSAECVDSIDYDYRVVAGIGSAAQLERVVRFYYTHKYFVRKSLRHDIALVEVDEPFPILPYIRPLRLHTNDLQLKMSPETRCVIAGFGDQGQQPSNGSLRIACVSIMSYRQCSEYYPTRMLPPHTLCAGDLNSPGVCHGDPGGPLVCLGVLVGVVATKYQCGHDPGIFLRLIAYTKRYKSTRIDWYSDEKKKKIIQIPTPLARGVYERISLVIVLLCLVINLIWHGC